MEKGKKSYDITQKLDVTKEELKVGTSREVSLSTGEVLNVNIPPKTVNGDVLSIKGLGKKKENGKRGNLNLVINFTAKISFVFLFLHLKTFPKWPSPTSCISS